MSEPSSVTGPPAGRRAKPWHRWAFCVLAGVLWACAFPRPSLAGAAWIAPGLLWFVSGSAPGHARRFRSGWIAGFAFALTALYWLLYIPFPAGAVAGWLALSAYVALYPAMWCWLMSRMTTALVERSTRAGHRDPMQPSESLNSSAQQQPDAITGPQYWAAVVGLSWFQRASLALFGAAAWTALEIVQGRFLSGFPWNFLGASQYQMLPLIQVAKWTGVYGVSFLVVWGSMSLAIGVTGAWARMTGHRRCLAAANAGFGPNDEAAPEFPASATSSRTSLMADLVVPILVLVSLVMQGVAQLRAPRPSRGEFKIALIQPSIPQRLIFDPAESGSRFKTLLELTELALATKPNLVVWPEASLPNFEESHYVALTNLISKHHVWMVFGADDALPSTTSDDPARYDWFNGAFLLNPRGVPVARYHKQRLVIFGEYVPLARWLPILGRLTPIQGGFATGKGPVPFHLGETGPVFSVLICFEDTFPHGARSHAEDDIDFLLNLTNNGWFGESAAQWQHAAISVFRALETGKTLVRCTNNGLTCWIDPSGGMHDVGPPEDVYAAGFKSVSIPLPPRTGERERGPPTFYVRHGDLFGWSCLGASILWLGILGGFWRKRACPNPQPGVG